MSNGKPTKEELLEYRELFQLFDVDRDGFVSVADLRQILKRGGLQIGPGGDGLGNIMQAAGKKADDKMSVEEFSLLVHRWAAIGQDEQVRDMFDMMDKGKTGRVGSKELRRILGCFGDSVSSQDVDDLIRIVDSDSDGRISVDELIELMH